jgi:hypothetical protein
MSTAPCGPSLPGLLAAAALAAGCTVPESRRHESQLSHALPEQDPASRGTAQGQHLPISEAEQLVVSLQRDAFGNVVLRQVVSPVLTPEEDQEVRRAFARGDWKRQLPLSPDAGTWTEVIVPNR